MIFQQFLEKYNGKPVDFDGAYGNQCMDLMHQYIYNVLGLTDKRILAAPGAKDVYLNYPNIVGSQFFDRFENTPTGIPKEGDIIFWGTKIGAYGHVAIFVEGDIKKFLSFDQNYPIGSLPHIQFHTYNGILGWLRFKTNVDIPSSLVKCQTDLELEIKNKNEIDQELQEVKSDLEGANSQIVSYDNFQKQLAITLNVESDQAKILGEVVKFREVEDQLRQAQKKIEELEKVITENNNLYSELNENHQALVKKNKDDLDLLQTVTKELESADEELKKYKASAEYIYKHFIFGLFTRKKVI